jgi:uncharacterized protein
MKIKHWFWAFILPFVAACNSTKKGELTSVFTNDLIHETSPYLLQHAYNPVNWMAWHDKTLQKAKAEQKLLLISIGYAACHWCHVMEHETFSDTAVAKVMNQYFVNIKIDREERPDIDNLYMTVCQLTKEGGCGWPLNIIALPDGRPIWVGTYMPNQEWLEALNYFIKAQQNELPKLEAYAEQLKQGIQSVGQLKPTHEKPVFDKKDLPFILENIVKTIDFENGGQKGVPKFPTPSLFDFLLNQYVVQSNSKLDPTNPKRDEILRGVTITLNKMANGGIYDHLQGGFARYSTDSIWKIPHFEKMLYDNAQLISLYSHAFQVTEQYSYKKVVRQTLDFVEQNWLSPEGGFYASFDADSATPERGGAQGNKGEEGSYYTWTKNEIDNLLGKNAPIFNDFYEIIDENPTSKVQNPKYVIARNVATEGGNWEHGRNILHKKTDSETEQGYSIKYIAQRNKTSEIQVETIIEQSEKTLLKARNKRIKPRLDNKILTAWNALMLKGCVDVYRALGEKHYLDLALKNAHFIVQKQLQKDGRLNRNYQNGKSSINGFLDDYVYTIQAFTALYQATFDEKWLFHAQKMMDYVLIHFEDSETGMFHFTSNIDAPLVARPVDFSENVLPNPNAVLALNLWDLGTLFEKPNYIAKATAMMQNMYNRAISEGHSDAYFNWCLLFSKIVNPPYEVAIVGKNAASLRTELMQYYLPNALILGGNTEGVLPLLEGKLQENETYIYVCQNKTCRYPVKTVKEALELMRQ